ncbi:putative RNA polymerase II subunit B1 CTD phosphatase RPAP2 [Amyelois transitella]|uniref:putative RNA polymerase II subunit B1 CTD phosphatase RPAP2 n=1 Tax=Amyelois transitella TaxID=680683 RepID=UPI002990739A|nr:putative RNA polymerase II subunit B1 CTD phosphatase RPAP2 [Amyelois transitella]
MDTKNVRMKKKPCKIEEMTKEQIREAIVKKRVCNAKAQTIVESLLEKVVTESYFLQCLPDINQSHFEDVIEERAIIHLCGYPLCQNALSEKDIPKQKYRISMKTNKVYDITARKTFCSNSCYRAAKFVKKQMLTSPLWFREYEEIPAFHLLPSDTVGSLGLEVDVSIIEKIEVKSDKSQFSSINDFATASLNEMTDTGNELTNIEAKVIVKNVNDCENNNSSSSSIGNLLKMSSEYSKEFVTSSVKHNQSLNINSVESQQGTQSNVSNQSNKEFTKRVQRKHNPLNIVGDIIEKPEKKIDPILAQKPDNIPKAQSKPKNVIKKCQPAVTVLTIEVEKRLAEWFTLDTLLLLFGEEKVREMVADKGECIKEYLNNYANSIAYNANTYDQYQALCRKLNMLELEDRQFDAQTLQRELKPLPDYSMLQEESKKMQLKVRAYFAGEMTIPDVSQEEQDTTPAEEESRPRHLPLVDKNAQNALRRRIVCEHLLFFALSYFE